MNHKQNSRLGMVKKGFQEYRDGKYRVREFGKHVVAHQGICHGQLTFKGTRVLVSVVLEALTHREQSIEKVAADFRVPVEAVAEALQIATTVVHEQLRLPDPHPEVVKRITTVKKRAGAARIVIA